MTVPAPTEPGAAPAAPSRPARRQPVLLDPATFPAEFDPDCYRALNSDLRHLSDEELVAHWERVGRDQGRRAHPLPDRVAFADLARGGAPLLEIGPSLRPVFRGHHVRYFETMPPEDLVRRDRAHGEPAARPPRIDFVSADGDLSVVRGRYAVVASSHVLEHTPDLVGHLQHVEHLLLPGGHYALFLPDRRYCLDALMPETTFADVLEAALERRTRHSLRTVVREHLLRTHNDPTRHWRGDHGAPEHLDADGVADAVRAYDEATEAGRYLDRHAWHLTPASFRQTVDLLHAVGLTALRPLRVYPTLAGSNEFWAILERPADAVRA